MPYFVRSASLSECVYVCVFFFSAVAQLVGNTPLVRLQRLNTNPRVDVLAKLEGANPAGSVKDRPALYMFQVLLLVCHDLSVGLDLFFLAHVCLWPCAESVA